MMLTQRQQLIATTDQRQLRDDVVVLNVKTSTLPHQVQRSSPHYGQEMLSGGNLWLLRRI